MRNRNIKQDAAVEDKQIGVHITVMYRRKMIHNNAAKVYHT